jgi:hypothetical protein
MQGFLFFRFSLIKGKDIIYKFWVPFFSYY